MTDQDERFAAELMHLADRIQPDANFKASLEQHLRVSHSTLTRSNEGQSKMTYRFSNLGRFIAAAAALLIVVTLTLAVPPLRSFAQEMLDLLFNRAASDNEVFETPVVVQLQTTPTVTFHEPRPALTVEQVEAQAGFDVLVPAYVPAGYELQDVYYDEGGKLVSQFYMRNGLGFNLVQMQAQSAEPLEVGASAEIIEVTIGDVVGQYVEGNWTVTSTRDGDTVTFAGQTWDSDFPFSQMRWQVGDSVFWLMTTLGQRSDLPLSEWEAMASSLQ